MHPIRDKDTKELSPEPLAAPRSRCAFLARINRAAAMYAEDTAWTDITPLPQDDGEQPLAQIAYTDEYSEAMSYLRAIQAKEEMSERALAITEHIIDMNPAHYTVWFVSEISFSPSLTFSLLYRKGVS